MSRLADFEPLLPAELKLVAWLRSGNRQLCQISDSVPMTARQDVSLRATFIRYLALGGCEDCRLPETGLRLAGAYILGDERRSDETQGLDLEGATLPGDLALVGCYIPDLLLLRSTKAKNLFLIGSVLKAGLSADRMQAEGDLSLRGARSEAEMRLIGIRLGRDLDCTGAQIIGQPAALNCDRMQAGGGVFLRGARIVGEVRLLGARMGGDLDCDSARLSSTGKSLNCDGAMIDGSFYLRGKARISGCIDLTAANLGGINDDPSCWPDEFILARCRYRAFLGRSPTDAATRLKWLALQHPGKLGQDFWPDPYEHCASVLREMGHMADAREILIEKERLQRKARRDRVARALSRAKNANARTKAEAGIKRYSDQVIANWMLLASLRVWDGILGAVVGYGRRPQNAAGWAFGVWLLGFLIFANAEGHGAIKPNLPTIQLNPAWTGCADDPRGQLECFLTHPTAASYPRFNAAIYSADALVPVVSLEMQSYWIPDDRSDRGMLARAYLWFHITMGWALTLLAVAGLSGLIKTDSK